MDVFVGTSGWSYQWNQKRSLEWYVTQAHLTSIELNGSFYRFPRAAHVASWAEQGAGLRWSVKVHRVITHLWKFSERALSGWDQFHEPFGPLENSIDFYLFQAGPDVVDTVRMIQFIDQVHLGDRFALEIRNRSLLGNDELCSSLQKHAVLVSVDSPHYEKRIFPADIVYLRMHGRRTWYQYTYSDEELQEIADLIREISPKRAYIYFNNDHSMLKNAQTMQAIMGCPLNGPPPGARRTGLP
jgi:uncharacterized protein YecE (DUF72 family)